MLATSGEALHALLELISCFISPSEKSRLWTPWARHTGHEAWKPNVDNSELALKASSWFQLKCSPDNPPEFQFCELWVGCLGPNPIFIWITRKIRFIEYCCLLIRIQFEQSVILLNLCIHTGHFFTFGHFLSECLLVVLDDFYYIWFFLLHCPFHSCSPGSNTEFPSP